MSTMKGGPNTIIDSSLILHLDAANTKSYVSGSANWNSLGKTQLSGSLINGPTFSSANGGSIVFDGSNDYITLGTPSSLNQVQVPLTICAWAKLNSIPAYTTIWGVYKATTGGQLYSLIRVDSGILRYYTSNSTGGFQYQGNLTVSANLWYFYAITVSGSISSPTVRIYLNNSSETLTYNACSSTPDSNIDFRIGASQVGESWNGNIADVWWYNRALSANEVLQNYNATKTRFGL